MTRKWKIFFPLTLLNINSCKLLSESTFKLTYSNITWHPYLRLFACFKRRVMVLTVEGSFMWRKCVYRLGKKTKFICFALCTKRYSRLIMRKARDLRYHTWFRSIVASNGKSRLERQISLRVIKWISLKETYLCLLVTWDLF